MIEQRKKERRMVTDRRSGIDRRVSYIDETQWLPPYGRRKLDTSDLRKFERRGLHRRKDD